ncbi:unnamed protein product [Owenia fusiformis]|uniref:Uncharacterized protein n=1 Tax=Owenia fusiformis TaxID=6347 RepID=A0A8J1V1N4_OWEFU|nr:unnamed protein product [Owenia fusiformis]
MDLQNHREVREEVDSKQGMEELFRVLNHPQKAQTLPYKQRNLPESFFNPQHGRNSASHSREGSTDSTNYHSNAVNSLPIVPVHTRSVSSPAAFQQTPLATPKPQTQHFRQHSVDTTLDGEAHLPPGWTSAIAQNGQKYFINHADQVTTWDDPRKILPSSSPAAAPAPQQATPNSSSTLGPLPPGWEQSVTPDGHVYFINHISKNTSWFDPRLTQSQQRSNIRTQLLTGSVPLYQQQQPQQQQPQQQQQTPSPQQPHIRQQLQQSPQGSTDYMKQLKMVQLERERLRAKEEALNKRVREMALLQGITVTTDNLTISSTPSAEPDLQSVNTTGIDPFLGQGGNTHNRENSADSGLGGMGTTYSLPRTPDDFLSNVDEMDATDGQKLQHNSEFNLDTMQGTLDMNASNTETNMDSDDLVPSLQEDISSELLQDVDLNPNKMDILTWL